MTYAQKARRWSHGAAIRVAGLIATMTISAPLAASATNTNYPQNTTLNMNAIGVNLTILAGSESDSLAVTSTNFTLTVAAGDTFTIKWSGPNPGKFVNGDGITDCTISGSDNQIAIVGPVTTTITPTASPTCVASGGSSGSGTPLSTNIFTPNGGESYNAGAGMNVQFNLVGHLVTGIRLSASLDGGLTYPVEITPRTTSFSSFNWVIPLGFAGTSLARVKAEALNDAGNVLVSDMSDANFTIIATPASSGGGDSGGGGGAPAPTPTPMPIEQSEANVIGRYNPNDAISLSGDINADKKLTLAPGAVALCSAGSLIKASLNAMYFCGADGKRYVFPNETTYKTWFNDFSNVIKLSDEVMAQITLGGNVTYRPGKRMIKITTDPKVYAIARGGILRPISGEDVAKALYGLVWNKMIDDVPDEFFFSYKVGLPITLFDVGGMMLSSDTAPQNTPASSKVAPTCSSSTVFTADMTQGSRGAQVLGLQMLLQCLGYIEQSVAVSGHFGEATTAGVKAFQSANGISPLGSVGPATRAALNEKY